MHLKASLFIAASLLSNNTAAILMDAAVLLSTGFKKKFCFGFQYANAPLLALRQQQFENGEISQESYLERVIGTMYSKHFEYGRANVFDLIAPNSEKEIRLGNPHAKQEIHEFKITHHDLHLRTAFSHKENDDCVAVWLGEAILGRILNVHKRIKNLFELKFPNETFTFNQHFVNENIIQFLARPSSEQADLLGNIVHELSNIFELTFNNKSLQELIHLPNLIEFLKAYPDAIRANNFSALREDDDGDVDEQYFKAQSALDAIIPALEKLCKESAFHNSLRIVDGQFVFDWRGGDDSQLMSSLTFGCPPWVR